MNGKITILFSFDDQIESSPKRQSLRRYAAEQELSFLNGQLLALRRQSERQDEQSQMILSERKGLVSEKESLKERLSAVEDQMKQMFSKVSYVYVNWRSSTSSSTQSVRNSSPVENLIISTIRIETKNYFLY